MYMKNVSRKPYNRRANRKTDCVKIKENENEIDSIGLNEGNIWPSNRFSEDFFDVFTESSESTIKIARNEKSQKEPLRIKMKSKANPRRKKRARKATYRVPSSFLESSFAISENVTINRSVKNEAKRFPTNSKVEDSSDEQESVNSGALKIISEDLKAINSKDKIKAVKAKSSKITKNGEVEDSNNNIKAVEAKSSKITKNDEVKDSNNNIKAVEAKSSKITKNGEVEDSSQKVVILNKLLKKIPKKSRVYNLSNELAGVTRKIYNKVDQNINMQSEKTKNGSWDTFKLNRRNSADLFPGSSFNEFKDLETKIKTDVSQYEGVCRKTNTKIKKLQKIPIITRKNHYNLSLYPKNERDCENLGSAFCVQTRNNENSGLFNPHRLKNVEFKNGDGIVLEDNRNHEHNSALMAAIESAIFSQSIEISRKDDNQVIKKTDNCPLNEINKLLDLNVIGQNNQLVFTNQNVDLIQEKEPRTHIKIASETNHIAGNKYTNAYEMTTKDFSKPITSYEKHSDVKRPKKTSKTTFDALHMSKLQTHLGKSRNKGVKRKINDSDSIGSEKIRKNYAKRANTNSTEIQKSTESASESCQLKHDESYQKVSTSNMALNDFDQSSFEILRLVNENLKSMLHQPQSVCESLQDSETNKNIINKVDEVQIKSVNKEILYSNEHASYTVERKSLLDLDSSILETAIASQFLNFLSTPVDLQNRDINKTHEKLGTSCNIMSPSRDVAMLETSACIRGAKTTQQNVNIVKSSIPTSGNQETHEDTKISRSSSERIEYHADSNSHDFTHPCLNDLVDCMIVDSINTDSKSISICKSLNTSHSFLESFKAEDNNIQVSKSVESHKRLNSEKIRSELSSLKKIGNIQKDNQNFSQQVYAHDSNVQKNSGIAEKSPGVIYQPPKTSIEKIPILISNQINESKQTIQSSGGISQNYKVQNHLSQARNPAMIGFGKDAKKSKVENLQDKPRDFDTHNRKKSSESESLVLKNSENSPRINTDTIYENRKSNALSRNPKFYPENSLNVKTNFQIKNSLLTIQGDSEPYIGKLDNQTDTRKKSAKDPQQEAIGPPIRVSERPNKPAKTNKVVRKSNQVKKSKKVRRQKLVFSVKKQNSKKQSNSKKNDLQDINSNQISEEAFKSEKSTNKCFNQQNECLIINNDFIENKKMQNLVRHNLPVEKNSQNSDKKDSRVRDVIAKKTFTMLQTHYSYCSFVEKSLLSTFIPKNLQAIKTKPNIVKYKDIEKQLSNEHNPNIYKNHDNSGEIHTILETKHLYKEHKCSYHSTTQKSKHVVKNLIAGNRSCFEKSLSFENYNVNSEKPGSKFLIPSVNELFGRHNSENKDIFCEEKGYNQILMASSQNLPHMKSQQCNQKSGDGNQNVITTKFENSDGLFESCDNHEILEHDLDIYSHSTVIRPGSNYGYLKKILQDGEKSSQFVNKPDSGYFSETGTRQTLKSITNLNKLDLSHSKNLRIKNNITAKKSFHLDSVTNENLHTKNIINTPNELNITADLENQAYRQFFRNKSNLLDDSLVSAKNLKESIFTDMMTVNNELNVSDAEKNTLKSRNTSQHNDLKVHDVNGLSTFVNNLFENKNQLKNSCNIGENPVKSSRSELLPKYEENDRKPSLDAEMNRLIDQNFEKQFSIHPVNQNAARHISNFPIYSNLDTSTTKTTNIPISASSGSHIKENTNVSLFNDTAEQVFFERLNDSINVYLTLKHQFRQIKSLPEARENAINLHNNQVFSQKIAESTSKSFVVSAQNRVFSFSGLHSNNIYKDIDIRLGSRFQSKQNNNKALIGFPSRYPHTSENIKSNIFFQCTDKNRNTPLDIISQNTRNNSSQTESEKTFSRTTEEFLVKDGNDFIPQTVYESENCGAINGYTHDDVTKLEICSLNVSTKENTNNDNNLSILSPNLNIYDAIHKKVSQINVFSTESIQANGSVHYSEININCNGSRQQKIDTNSLPAKDFVDYENESQIVSHSNYLGLTHQESGLQSNANSKNKLEDIFHPQNRKLSDSSIFFSEYLLESEIYDYINDNQDHGTHKQFSYIHKESHSQSQISELKTYSSNNESEMDLNTNNILHYIRSNQLDSTDHLNLVIPDDLHCSTAFENLKNSTCVTDCVEIIQNGSHNLNIFRENEGLELFQKSISTGNDGTEHQNIETQSKHKTFIFDFKNHNFSGDEPKINISHPQKQSLDIFKDENTTLVKHHRLERALNKAKNSPESINYMHIDDFVETELVPGLYRPQKVKDPTITEKNFNNNKKGPIRSPDVISQNICKPPLFSNQDISIDGSEIDIKVSSTISMNSDNESIPDSKMIRSGVDIFAKDKTRSIGAIQRELELLISKNLSSSPHNSQQESLNISSPRVECDKNINYNHRVFQNGETCQNNKKMALNIDLDFINNQNIPQTPKKGLKNPEDLTVAESNDLTVNDFFGQQESILHLYDVLADREKSNEMSLDFSNDIHQCIEPSKQHIEIDERIFNKKDMSETLFGSLISNPSFKESRLDALSSSNFQKTQKNLYKETNLKTCDLAKYEAKGDFRFQKSKVIENPEKIKPEIDINSKIGLDFQLPNIQKKIYNSNSKHNSNITKLHSKNISTTIRQLDLKKSSKKSQNKTENTFTPQIGIFDHMLCRSDQKSDFDKSLNNKYRLLANEAKYKFLDQKTCSDHVKDVKTECHEIKTHKPHQNHAIIRHPRRPDFLRNILAEKARGYDPMVEYVPRMIVPKIVDDRIQGNFIPPQWANMENVKNITRNYNHDKMSELFRPKAPLDLKKIFPDHKHITNNSPNRWI